VLLPDAIFIARFSTSVVFPLFAGPKKHPILGWMIPLKILGGSAVPDIFWCKQSMVIDGPSHERVSVLSTLSFIVVVFDGSCPLVLCLFQPIEESRWT
jgi:hypothetical protein